MWVCLPTFSGDVHLAKDLLKWCQQLDGRLSHGCLLAADCATDWFDASELLRLANDVFQRVELITTEVTVGSWPAGPNSLFQTAAQWFMQRKIGPWFWMEPDAVPLKKGWLDSLEAAYASAGKPFMGAVMQADEPHLAGKYLAGCAVYPADAWKRMSPAWDDCRAFDVATAPATVPFTADTPMLQHFWGQRDLPPTFVEATPEFPVNDFTVPDWNKLTLANIKPEAVLFHRNKDGTLLRLLGYREPKPTGINLDVVLSFYSADSALMLKNLKWMNAMHGKKDATAVLLADTSASASVQHMSQAARGVFERVIIHSYSSHAHGWPTGPNQAFQNACLFMAGREGKPGWFWMEPDAIPVAPDWLEQLSAEYIRAGKPFMGTIIGEMDHLNGVAVYPANVQHYCPSLMNIKAAWDTALHPEMVSHRHRANSLIQHHRSPPSFASDGDLREVEPGVVIFHPEKSGRLIDWLARKMFQ